MNKIIIDNDKDLILDKNEYDIEIKSNSNINISILNNPKVKLLIKNSKVFINIKLNDNSNIIINQLGIDSSINYNVSIKNNCNILVVDSILSKNDSVNQIKLINEGNNNNIRFYTNGINLSHHKMYFNIDGIVSKDCCNVYLEENSKIINIHDGDSKIIPNLIIDTKEISANHSAFIGTLNINDLLYLMSRGIDNNNAKKLLMKSILLSKMELNTEDFIKEIALNLDMGGFYE